MAARETSGKDETSGNWALILRRQVHDLLELDAGHDPVTRTINSILVVLIFLNVLAFSIETVPRFADQWGPFFWWFNLVSVLIFTVEYAARVWSCVEIPGLGVQTPWRARLRFAARPLQIVDLLAIMPFYLSFLIPMDLRILRILRIFRFLKLARYSPALQSLGRTFANERRALVGALLVMLALLLFASTGIYFFERNAQPEVFGSIPAAAWWALATLTTVGYGDVVPVTPAGRVFGGLVMIFGLGMFALPIAIVAAGFSQEANRREFVVTWSMVARVPLFAHLDAANVARIMNLLFARQCEPGTRIIATGDVADAMYFLASGEVVVHTEAGEVILGEGDFFGEMALFEGRPRQNDVVALTRCRLLVLDYNDFEHLCQREPEIANQIRGVAKARGKAGAARPKSKGPVRAL